MVRPRDCRPCKRQSLSDVISAYFEVQNSIWVQATVKHICFDLRCYILKSPPRHPNESMCLLLTLLIQIAENLAEFAQKAPLFVARIQPHLEMVSQFYTRNHQILGFCDTLFTLFAIGNTNLFFGKSLN